eukprot:7364254-Prymnesium_polylepis.1
MVSCVVRLRGYGFTKEQGTRLGVSFPRFRFQFSRIIYLLCTARPSGSTGIVRSRQKCFTKIRLGVFRRSWSDLGVFKSRHLLCSSTPPCPASEA